MCDQPDGVLPRSCFRACALPWASEPEPERRGMADEEGSGRTRSLLVAIVAVMMVALLAVGVVALTKTTRATSDDRWKPRSIDIGRGDRVRWTNPTEKIHNVKAWGGTWTFFERLSPGESARKTFKRRGTFRFRCTLHSDIVSGKCQGMCGVVHV